jgi:hypothetical protein
LTGAAGVAGSAARGGGACAAWAKAKDKDEDKDEEESRKMARARDIDLDIELAAMDIELEAISSILAARVGGRTNASVATCAVETTPPAPRRH